MHSPVLSASEAARLLPLDDAAAMVWLENAGLVHLLLGRRVVVWSEVLAAVMATPRTSEQVDEEEADLAHHIRDPRYLDLPRERLV